MFTEGIFPIENGLLDIDEARLKSLLVQDDINEIYDVEQTPFARGKFAAVRRAVHKDSGVHFAAKFLKRRRRAQSSDKEIKHEIAVLTLCDGAENIVKLNAVHESRSDTALLLELATGGELQTFLDNEECLSESDARFSMREVLKGLQFLHKCSIAHLDLKPQNILLTGERIEDGLKLCDFGISRVVVEGTNVREIVGTPDYVAPEVLQYEPLSLLTDIWSVGVLAYVLLSGFSPFGGETKQETFLNISQCSLTFPEKLFGGVSAAAIDFIRRALRIKPSDRMTAAGCLEHFWLKDDCSIDRHIFGNGKTLTSAALDAENGDDDDDDEDDEEDEDEDEDEEDEHDISIETDEAEDDNGIEEEFEISSDENNSIVGGIINGSGSKMDSSDLESETLNGGSLVNGTTKSPTTTIAAARATTIPICHTKQPQQQQQQQQQINLTGVRRHSTDSNKENTYLATKKIMPTNNLTTVVKKSTTTATTTPTIQPATINKSTATIIIGTEHQKHQQQQQKQQQMESSNSNSNSNSAPCLFPDAPTTPKVIRKAPNTETSPTSVKALVKKFQLEGAEKHLKEAQSNQQQHQLQHQHQHRHQHQQQQQQQLPNNVGPRKSLPTTLTNGKLSTADHNKKLTNGIQQNKSNNNNSKPKHITNITSNGHSYMSNRRLSEPITAVHHQQQHKKSHSTTFPSMSPPKSPLSTATDAVMNYKTTCVYCLTCGSSSNCSSTIGCVNIETNGANECRHSTTATPSLSLSSQSSASSTAKGTTTTATLNVGSRNSTTAAILLSNHQQIQNHHHQLSHHNNHHHHPHHHHHHHHHHHVVVTKNVAANNLSLDQGIIC